jgi:hypothetical protein
VVPVRGTLSVTVRGTGRPSVLIEGAPAGNLLAGTYRIAVNDSSPRAGLVLSTAGHASRTLSTVNYVGKRSESVKLTPGRWTFTSGASRYSVAVR